MNIVKKIKKISFIEAEKVWYKATLDMDDEIDRNNKLGKQGTIETTKATN